MSKAFEEALERFSRTLTEIDQVDLQSYKKRFFGEIDAIADLIRHDGDGAEGEKDAFFRLCGMLDQSLMHGRTRNKPLGYAGDYLLIDWIYTRKTGDRGRGRLFDELFHSYEAAAAVRNRKEYFVRLCADLTRKAERRIDVLDIGCGSCRDVLEAFETCHNGKHFHADCVDHEPGAIAYAQTLLAGTPAESFVRLECRNAFRWQSDKTYDLIWSAGLFDYLDDRMASLLLRRCWRVLKRGGLFVFGNFSPSNPTRNGMELVGRWVLIHRTANQLIALVEKAGVPYAALDVESESLGINLFCRIRK